MAFHCKRKQVTPCCNIIADGWSGASNPHPNPKPYSCTQKHLKHAFSDFSTHADGWTNEPTGKQTNEPTDKASCSRLKKRGKNEYLKKKYHGHFSLTATSSEQAVILSSMWKFSISVERMRPRFNHFHYFITGSLITVDLIWIGGVPFMVITQSFSFFPP